MSSNDGERHANTRKEGKFQNAGIGQTLFSVFTPIFLKDILEIGKCQGGLFRFYFVWHFSSDVLCVKGYGDI